MGDDTRHDEFTEFVHATGPRLHRAAVLMTGDPHLAEDLVQTTYTKLFVAWKKVQRAGNPVGYARTTLTHVFLSHRRVKRNSELPSDDLPDAGTHDPAIERLDLLAALRTLPETDRAILVLRYWEGLTVAETATEVGLSEIAVRSRASRAAARIRPLLAETLEEA